MNCNLCKHELEAYREGRLPDGIRAQVEAHLAKCSDCSAIYQMETIANRVMDTEKQIQSNPFLATRIMAGVEALEQRSERIPAYRKALKPVLVSISIAAAILVGIFAGSIYQPSQKAQGIPAEMAYINDATLESVDYLATK
ncbi:MAG TPA: zf-HC2 domain-containing protein [Bacteroidales bacterium]|nr:zf-HC2 domain-containing protein [Bacteroidales bacterium]